MAVESCLRAVSRGMEWYAEGAVQIRPDDTFEGQSAIRERLARELAACPDLGLGFGTLVEQDDGFADELTNAGTHAGSFSLPEGTELPSTGERIEVKGRAGECQSRKIVVDNRYYYNWPSRPSSVYPQAVPTSAG